MKATELRIGNILRDKKTGTYIRFTSFYGLCNVECNPDKYEPVHLTDEILRDWCGMKEELPGMFYSEEDVKYTQTGFPYGFIISRFGRKDGKYAALNSGRLRGIESLHQLQNLHFALTGEELTVKTPTT